MSRLPALLLLAAGLSPSCVGACEAADRGVRLEFKLSLAEKAGRWIFAIDGTTDLPAATLLRARIYVVTILDNPVRGLVEDEEPLVRRDDEFQPEIHPFKAGSGLFHEEVAAFARKPYSLRYRAKIQYDPHDQTDAITLKVGDFEFSRQADLRWGSDDSFESELKERVAEIGKDLQALDKLGGDLRGWSVRAPGNPAEWKAWKERAAAGISAMLEGNRLRYDLWAVWPEYQARMRIPGLCGYLEKIIGERELQEVDPARIGKLMAAFVASLDDAVTMIGCDLPLDAREAGAAIDAYEAAVAPLRTGRPEVCRQARAKGVAALFDLLDLLRTRRREYVYLNTMGVRLERLVELIEAKAAPEEIADAFRAHETALRDFRRVSGLRP